MNLIAAVDRNWAIGNKGQLLVRIPGDHRMFRQETLDKVVVYGRKTLETFPMAQPPAGIFLTISRNSMISLIICWSPTA